MKRKILYVSPFPHLGGGEISLLTLINSIDKSMFDCSIICYAEGPFTERVVSSGIGLAIFRRETLLDNLLIILNLFRCIKKNGIDIVHVNCLDIRAAIAARLANVPLIGHLRVIFPFAFIDRLFVRLSNKVIAVSNAVIDSFGKNHPFLKDKFVVIPNAVKMPDNLAPAPIRKEYGIPENAKVVGAVGRIDSWKGFEYFIRAAAILSAQRQDIFFLIVGAVSRGDEEGEKYLDRLRREIEMSGLASRMFLTGFREDALNVIKAFDILVVPSITIKKKGGEVAEGFGRVAIEAMAVEVPVVATNTGGLKEIIEDGISGVIIPPADENEISKAVFSIIEDKDKADALSKEGMKRASKYFSIENNVRMTCELYVEVLKND